MIVARGRSCIVICRTYHPGLCGGGSLRDRNGSRAIDDGLQILPCNFDVRCCCRFTFLLPLTTTRSLLTSEEFVDGAQGPWSIWCTNNIVPHDVESEEERLTGWKVFLYKGDSAGKTGKIGWSVVMLHSEGD